MNQNFYIPVRSSSLPIYFGNACIAPSKYLNNKLEDLQDRFSGYILISNKLISADTDCCIEVVLTKTEIEELILIDKQENLYLLDRPLPISRVNYIFFENANQLEKTITNINLATAFIPKRLLRTYDKFETVSVISNENLNKLENHNWEIELKRFNSILGGFALMKNSGEDYMNFSENYFSTLSFFNKAIEIELIKSKKEINRKYFDAFLGKDRFHKLYPILNKNVTESDLEDIAQSENQKINRDKFTKLVDLNNLNHATLITAILVTFGVGEESRKKRIDGLILSNFRQDIPSDKSEIIALCYGLNRGYSIFQNKYKLGNQEKTIKLQLESKLDYYTLESIYQYVFNNERTERIPFIDNIQFGETNTRPFIKSSDYQIFDTVVIGKKKPKVLSEEYLSNLLHYFIQKDNSNYFKELFKRIIEILYNDISEELIESTEILTSKTKKELETKQVEIENLQIRIKELTKTVSDDSKTTLQQNQHIKEKDKQNKNSGKTTKSILEQQTSVLNQEVNTQDLTKGPESKQKENFDGLENTSNKPELNFDN